MLIWIDITNSPHVLFFAPFIRDLQRRHEILITCRPLSNTIELLKQGDYNYHIVGKHYGANKYKKTLGFLIRIWQLYFFLRKYKVDVAISHSSFYSPVVAKLLGIKSIYLNDNEHAIGNYISFKFADKIMIPQYLNKNKVLKQGATKDKLVQYPGVKEGVYLWNFTKQDTHPKRIYIRPEPWTAQYYKGRKYFIDELIIDLQDKYEIVLLPRDSKQAAHYRQKRFSKLTIPTTPLTLDYIIKDCLLFVGAGGTMTREAAVLGIPTISIYQDRLLDVDNYLINNNRMTHKIDIDSNFVCDFLKNNNRDEVSDNLTKKGNLAYKMIIHNIMIIGETVKKC